MTQILINSKSTLGQTGISLGRISKMLLKPRAFCCSICYVFCLCFVLCISEITFTVGIAVSVRWENGVQEWAKCENWRSFGCTSSFIWEILAKNITKRVQMKVFSQVGECECRMWASRKEGSWPCVRAGCEPQGKKDAETLLWRF